MASLEGHGDDVGSLAVLGGGRLASASEDRYIKIWEIATGVGDAGGAYRRCQVLGIAG